MDCLCSGEKGYNRDKKYSKNGTNVLFLLYFFCVVWYNVRDSNEQCQSRQRQIDCLQTNLSVSALTGRSPRVRKTGGFSNSHCGRGIMSVAEYLAFVASTGERDDSIEMRYEDENI